MKSLLTIGSILLLSSIGSAQAVTFNNSDGSRLTAVCIASAESEKALNLKAREHGFSQKDLDSFTCNGLSVQEFGQKYRGMTSEETVKVYARWWWWVTHLVVASRFG